MTRPFTAEDIEKRNIANKRAWAEKQYAIKAEKDGGASIVLTKQSKFRNVKTEVDGIKRMQALGRLKVGQMNGTEKAYGEVLEVLKGSGEVLWYKFEGLKFRLSDDTFYTPDYAVMTMHREIELHEVKGFWQDDAKVKIKVASDMYPFRFIAVQKLAKKLGGGWKVVEF